MSADLPRRAQADAWRELHAQLAEGGSRGSRRGSAPRFAGLRSAALPLVTVMMLSVPVAIAAPGDDENDQVRAAAGEGQPVDLARRNPGSGGANRETAVVADVGNNGLVVRPSNTAKGGRAISATCDNDSTAAEAGCAVYVNKGQGAAASFRTQGSVPFALRNTNNGRVEFLNADRVDDLHASEIVTQARTKTNLDADTVDGLSANALIRGAFAEDDSLALVGVDGNALTTTIEVPTNGFLFMSASSDVFNFTQNDFVTCRLRFDGAIVTESTRQLQLDGASTENVNQEEDCSTDGIQTVTPGTYTIALEGAGLATGTVFDESALQVMFIPFGSTGTQP